MKITKKVARTASGATVVTVAIRGGDYTSTYAQKTHGSDITATAQAAERAALAGLMALEEVESNEELAPCQNDTGR